LQNLITSTDLATIFVDCDFKIKFYTPRAQDIFSLIPTDVGRPLSDITHKLDYASMLQDMRQVLDDGHKTELEVKSRQGRWYIAELIPYRLHGDQTVGVILTFIDFTRRKLAENETQAAREGLERHTVSLMEINEALQTEVRERQRAERERGQLLRRIVFAQEEERARIAREMHDQFGQQLTVLNLKLDALKKDCGDHTKLCDQVETLQALAQQLDADVDSLVWEMRPMALDDLGLEAALTSYVQNWSTHLGIPVDLHSTAIVYPSILKSFYIALPRKPSITSPSMLMLLTWPSCLNNAAIRSRSSSRTMARDSICRRFCKPTKKGSD
jgi:two-component system CheB/CheR fusion protein